jgi:hypothetical protein
MVVGFFAVFLVIRVGKKPSLSRYNNINLDHSTRITPVDLLLNLHARIVDPKRSAITAKKTVPSLLFNEKISNNKLSEAERVKGNPSWTHFVHTCFYF